MTTFTTEIGIKFVLPSHPSFSMQFQAKGNLDDIQLGSHQEKEQNIM